MQVPAPAVHWGTPGDVGVQSEGVQWVYDESSDQSVQLPVVFRLLVISQRAINRTTTNEFPVCSRETVHCPLIT